MAVAVDSAAAVDSAGKIPGKCPQTLAARNLMPALPMIDSPPRRVILLGASNLARRLPR
ncbi:unnamed protein product [marine sediment metagenome]|uniref:Uncharacterized protein n=1 Tax=marine sediment metagenome TaxID=412755 RepID=X0YLG9_9ZZZZ